jgi:hypothetical protein
MKMNPKNVIFANSTRKLTKAKALVERPSLSMKGK